MHYMLLLFHYKLFTGTESKCYIDLNNVNEPVAFIENVLLDNCVAL